MSLSTQVRDNVHGFIRWNDEVVRIIDTPTFQRLRGIRQLAFAHYVYPGATHSRFNHSLGVYHLASRICDKLEMKPDADDRRTILLAALLHDVGHAPFSHVSEDVLSMFSPRRPKGAADATSKIHERITADVIRHDNSLSKVLSQQARHDVVKLLDEGLGDPVNKAIVSGPLDADKMDYLLRDSMNCGVRYGVYDPDQLISSLDKIKDADRGHVLIVEEDGLHCVEQFILAKYHITNQVYRHKVRLISDAMVVRGLSEGIRHDHVKELRKLYEFRSSPDYVRFFLKWDDEAVLRAFTTERYSSTHVGDILLRLRRRQLYKQVYSKRIVRIEVLGPSERMALADAGLDDTRLKAVEEAVAEEFDIEPYEVIVTVQKVSRAWNRKQQSDSEGSDESEGRILIARKGSTPVSLEGESTLFAAIQSELKVMYLDCYMPAHYDRPTERDKLLNRVSKSLETALCGAFKKEEKK